MEIGAVKQAFNNEIILLKKNLNQAKIQTIHKLTRKAKTLAEKKAPEALKEKLKRKAESAVKEVLIIKKIKAKDIARFIVTHTGKLNDFLNKPTVDIDKACARLLLHKALQDKYQHLRVKFLGISIKDLFMSRQERLKLKKEAREIQKNKKNKKKGKSDTVNVEGEWDVQIIDHKNIPGDKSKSDDNYESVNDKGELSNEEYGKSDESSNSHNENHQSDNENEIGHELEEKLSTNEDDINQNVNGVNTKSLLVKIIESDMKCSDDSKDVAISRNKIDEPKKVYSNEDNIINFDTESKEELRTKTKDKNDEMVKTVTNYKEIKLVGQVSKPGKLTSNDTNKKLDKKVNNKNKNLKNKLESRNFRKEFDETPNQATKMVDPFFITSTGQNYMSLVEPRQPDEVKEVHRQGNRQYRRAVMFGHVPKPKPSRNYFELGNNSYKKNNVNRSETDSNFTNNKFNEFNQKDSFKRKSGLNSQEDSLPEKLHPSWEAKKKKSGILPFEGKKIVFDES